MIKGSGDIASVLPDRDDLWFFASGVSNSQCTDESEYQREITLLMAQTAPHIVYFSSLMVLNSNTRYARHKRTMEGLVKQYFEKYTIIRIGNINFGTNPHTLINYLRAHPEAEIRDEYRHIITKDELLYWIDLIPSWSVEMNCPGERLKVSEIVNKYVHLGLPA